jgi:hypothetical protein
MTLDKLPVWDLADDPSTALTVMNALGRYDGTDSEFLYYAGSSNVDTPAGLFQGREPVHSAVQQASKADSTGLHKAEIWFSHDGKNYSVIIVMSPDASTLDQIIQHLVISPVE